MIKINYRIISSDHFVSWKKMDITVLGEEIVDGWFQIIINSSSYGMYFKEPLWAGETGQYVIDVWFWQLGKAVALLRDSGYCAIKDIETPASWLEMKKVDDILLISVANLGSDRNPLISSTPLHEPKYLEWKDEKILFSEFVTEVKEKASSFLNELTEINPKFLDLPKIREIKSLLEI